MVVVVHVKQKKQSQKVVEKLSKIEFLGSLNKNNEKVRNENQYVEIREETELPKC